MGNFAMTVYLWYIYLALLLNKQYSHTCSYVYVLHSLVVHSSPEAILPETTVFIPLQRTSPDTVQLVLVGNKCDLEEKRKVTREEGEEMAASIGASFFEVSAKTGVNINEV